jgi:hypothetical protein
MFLLWHALSTVGPQIDRCVPLQIMSNQLKLPQVDYNQVQETSQGWSMEKGCALPNVEKGKGLNTSLMHCIYTNYTAHVNTPIQKIHTIWTAHATTTVNSQEGWLNSLCVGFEPSEIPLIAQEKPAPMLNTLSTTPQKNCSQYILTRTDPSAWQCFGPKDCPLCGRGHKTIQVSKYVLKI